MSAPSLRVPASPEPQVETRLELHRYPVHRARLPRHVLRAGPYQARFARSAADLDRVLRLRFEVFNLELGEGLDSAYASGRDEDDLDARFHHLMIVHEPSGTVAGTYRMQTAEMAAACGGFYSSGEYDLSGVPAAMLARSVEVGRACVARAHRNGRTLHLLWRGLASYLTWNRKTLLFGCCSLPGQDEAVARAVAARIEREGHLHPAVRVAPLPHMACALGPVDGAAAELPPLFAGYLALGARVWGPPAVDRLFKTMDFLVGLDVHEMHPRVYRRFFG